MPTADVPGQRATIGDVAREARVSKGTVSLAYSGKRKISEPTRQRIFAAAERLQWAPSSPARALATRRSNALGIVLCRDPRILASDSFFPSFLAGVEQALNGRDMALILQVVSSPAAETRAYRNLGRGRVDGVILLDLERDDQRIPLVDRLGIPAVILGDYGPSDLPSVYADDRASVRALLDHLMALGHRRIAHVAGPDRYVHSIARREAFVEHLRASGLDHTLVRTGDFTAESGRGLTRALLSLPERPTAICYANDVMAMAGLTLAQQSGLVVPDDLSVTGFDDSELSAHLSPGLTTVSTDAFTRGVRSAESLLASIEGHPLGDLELDCNRLQLRASTGRCPPLADPISTAPHHHTAH